MPAESATGCDSSPVSNSPSLCAWRGRLLPGCKDRYLQLHREIWPEMVAVLKSAGIAHYTIWVSGDDVFASFEATLGLAYARQVQAASPVVRRWADEISSLMTVDRDPLTGLPTRLELAFHLT